MSSITTLLLLLLFLVLQNYEFAHGGKRKVHISDDLDDVYDDEEDESWKEWGKKKEPSFPPADLSKMEPSQIKEEMMKRHTGPVIGFVKLRFGFPRTPDMVAEIAMKWSQVMRTGGIGIRFMGVDTSTIMFNMESIKGMDELKDFIFDQSEAYEIKIGNDVFRRPGDPPLEEVLQNLQKEKTKADNAGQEENDGDLRTEL
ncbi:hypothetical protein AAHE18_04G178300 [Arachis hypogaea]